MSGIVPALYFTVMYYDRSEDEEVSDIVDDLVERFGGEGARKGLELVLRSECCSDDVKRLAERVLEILK